MRKIFWNVTSTSWCQKTFLAIIQHHTEGMIVTMFHIWWDTELVIPILFSHLETVVIVLTFNPAMFGIWVKLLFFPICSQDQFLQIVGLWLFYFAQWKNTDRRTAVVPCKLIGFADHVWASGEAPRVCVVLDVNCNLTHAWRDTTNKLSSVMSKQNKKTTC